MPKLYRAFPFRSRVAVLSCLVPVLALVAVGCSADDDRASPQGDLETPGVDAGGKGGGDDGGSDGGAGDNDGGGGGSNGDDDAGPDAEVDGSPSDGAPDGDEGYPPSDSVCDRDVAFRSNSISFVFPTNEALGRAIERFLSDPDSHHYVLALRGSKGADADGAISAADVSEGIYSFPVGAHKPLPTSVSLSQGRFDSGTQGQSFLIFQDEVRTVTIQLQDVRFTAFTQGNCQQAIVVVDATIPQFQAGVPIQVDGASRYLHELAGMRSESGYVSVGIRFLVTAEATSFDFSSL